jgi:hypothetical protein
VLIEIPKINHFLQKETVVLNLLGKPKNLYDAFVALFSNESKATAQLAK